MKLHPTRMPGSKAALLLILARLAVLGPVAAAGDTTSIAPLPCTQGREEAIAWPTLARLDDDAFALVTVNTTRTEDRDENYLRLDIIDSIGNCRVTGATLRPGALDSIGGIWQPAGLTEVFYDPAGRIVVPALGRRHGAEGVDYVQAFMFVVPGRNPSDYCPQQILTLVDSGRYNLPPVDLRADLSDSGRAFVIWLGQQRWAPFHNKLMTQKFNVDEGEFLVAAVRDPLPAGIYDPTTRPSSRTVGPTPIIGDLGDGGSVAAWVLRIRSRSHLCYAILNHRLSLERTIAVADCDDADPYADSADCTTGNVHTIALDVAPDRSFCLVWTNIDPIPYTHHTRTHLWMRWFDRGGEPLTVVIRVDDADSTNIVNQQQVYPAVTIGPGGTAAVVWSDARNHPSSSAAALRSDVFVQFVSPDGRRFGDNILVSDGSGFDGLKGTHFDAAWIDADRCLLVWRHFGDTGEGGLCLSRVSVPR